MTTPTCPHCNRLLEPASLAEGWCCRCARQLPAELVAASRKANEAAAAAVAPPAGRELGLSVFVTGAWLILVGVLVGLALAAGGSPLKISGAILKVVMIWYCVAQYRAIMRERRAVREAGVKSSTPEA